MHDRIMTSESCPASLADPAAALHHEMRVRFGVVPEAISNVVYREDGFALSPTEFVFTTDGGVRFHYAVGEGIVASLPDFGGEDEFRLYLWGTVFGAVAWLNGFFPLHASAVAVGRQAIAFTADSGAGKSTLAAALAALGLPHICDDTLALHLDPASVVAVPDRKPLKLWEDAFDLVSARRIDPIATMPGKSYAQAANSVAAAMPLGHLIMIEQGDAVNLTPVRGAAKLDVLAAAMYRDFIRSALGRRSDYTRDLIAIANGVGIWRLTRPRSDGADAFGRTTEHIAEIIASLGKPS